MAPRATWRCSLALLLGGTLLLPAAAERWRQGPGAPAVAPAPSPQKAAALKDVTAGVKGPATEKAAVDAEDASSAAASAEAAADVAKEVATHSIRMTRHAKAALKKAQEAVHTARVGSEGLSENQTKALKQAEEHLAKASKTVPFGNSSSAESRLRERLARLKEKLGASHEKSQSELSAMREELHALRERLRGTSQEQQAEEIERLLEELEKRDSAAALSHDELKAELERLREAVRHIEDIQDKLDAERAQAAAEQAAKEKRLKEKREARKEEEGGIIDGDWDKLEKWGRRHRHPDGHDKKKLAHEHKDDSEEEGEAAKIEEEGTEEPTDEGETTTEEPKEGGRKRHRRKGKKEGRKRGKHDAEEEDSDAEEQTAELKEADDAPEAEAEEGSGGGSIDVDTEMPYGDLEPFGREDTAQELTEASIRESNAMVDQLERAEVAEEKRAIFRALTRLRGAAITSFDGIARSQTGTIDAYNKVHQWRGKHPLRHLADQESDISKWAFPDANF